MTRAQRRRHLAMWIVVGPAALLVVVLAMVVRPARLPAEAPPPSGGRP